MASNRDRSAAARAFRAEMKAHWQDRNQACGICGQNTIDWAGQPNAPESFELDHIKPVISFPELEADPNNVRPSHSRCNRGKGAGKELAAIGETSEAW